MVVIEVKDLEKVFKIQKREEGFSGTIKGLFRPQYDEKLAVNKISFEIARGEIVAYIGPNGAGKSTTIKMLVGILVPTSGDILINGIVPYKNRIQNSKNIGVVFGQRTQLWWDIPVKDSLNIMKYLYKIPEAKFKQNLQFLIEVLDMKDFINTPVRQLSLGQRMRSDLCAALIHNPQILFLDEPTIGLDVLVKERIRNFIKEINREYKTTVILTTHDISDIEKLCSRVIVINKGRNVFDGKLDELRNYYGFEEQLLLETEGVLENKNELIVDGVIKLNQDNEKLNIVYDKRILTSSQILTMVIERCKLKDFVVEEACIEDIVKAIYVSK